jgi:uncharacterized membrane protein YhaH (DUF805 family)
MKINVVSIFTDHLRTLRQYEPNDERNDEKSEFRISREDFLLFFLVPGLLAAIGVALGATLDKDAYGMSISVFAIFSGLLLNVQIALFSVYQRTWTTLTDRNLDDLKQKNLQARNILLSEVNTNISYLVILSCTAVIIFFLSYMIKSNSIFMSSISLYIYSHFFLTLLMVIKRAHALFDNEYSE